MSNSSFTLSPQICRFKWIFLRLVLLIGLFLFPSVVFGAIPFEDNFNSYNLGNLSGQGFWTGSALYQIVDTGCLEGHCVQSTSTGGTLIKTGSSTSGNTSFYFYFKVPSAISGGEYQGLRFWQSTGEYPFAKVVFFGSHRLKVQGSNLERDFCIDYSYNIWHKVEVEFSDGLSTIRARCDDGDWSLTDTISYYNSNFSRVQIIELVENIYLDYISETEYTEPPSSGYSVIIEPTYPIDCQFSTTTAPISFNATGKITIPTENENWYSWFGIMAESYTTGEQFSTSTTFSPLLKAGDIYNYNLFFSLSDDAYKISYWLTGWNPDWQIPVGHIHYCEGTGIGTSLPEPEIIIPEFPGYEPEDCSEYALLEKLVCEIKNFLKSLVYPSTSKINELKTNLSAFRTKIPLNYLTASKDFVSDINNQISTTTLNLAMFDSATTTLDFSILNATNTIAGISVSLKDILKTLTSTMLIFGFIGWAIAFKNRIFR